MLKARQKVGKYRIERRLAEGPIASVYEAVDTIHGVNVALKIPHESSMDDFFLADFKREARLAQRLEHPNILPIRDASFIDGRFVIAMPLGECSLSNRMKRRLGTESALHLVEQAVAAVAHAHGQNVIHCDIKPDNFILFSDHQLKLTDFGFSKVAQRTLKASGSGTVGYIAPEQAVGRPKFQSDVFSLGLVIYELLSGHLPEWPYDWPPRGIKRVRSKLKPKLVDWLRRAIEVRPENRYRNAVTMYRELRRVRNGAAKKKRSARRAGAADDPPEWQTVLFRQFQRKYRKALDTRYECRQCSGPVAEFMQACPWCGTEPPLDRHASRRERAECPRCHRGVKLDWHYCPSCYGPGFEVETTRRYADRRYSAKCRNERCRGPQMPFMRYCPWCRAKTKRPWKLPGSEARCPHCRWGVDANYWHHCPWCTKALEA
ncbi:MAG TPA: serine/threonine-protein kinase [Gammaproteobacteria bacterium]|nr:serine/threonine-protein kinase [Gammaproteobacteria bacterium]